MVPTKCEMNGKLCGGDSYILLSTTMKGSAFSWHLHFWLGDETSQDEAGVAAYKVWSLCGGWCAVTWKGRRDGVQGMVTMEVGVQLHGKAGVMVYKV